MDLKVSPEQGRFALAPEVILQTFEDKAILIDLTSEQVYQLNETGARALALLQEDRSLAEAFALLDQSYAADPGDIEQGVVSLIADLLSRHLIVQVQS